jgi:hypothetical protein
VPETTPKFRRCFLQSFNAISQSAFGLMRKVFAS